MELEFDCTSVEFDDSNIMQWDYNCNRTFLFLKLVDIFNLLGSQDVMNFYENKRNWF